MSKVVAVVVTYNRKLLLKECINSLLNQTKPLDIIIIDNASTDGTKNVVNSFISKNLKYFNTGKNLGGAGGFNYGIKKAVELGYDFCWVMDDDTIPNKDALEEMINMSKKLNNEFSFLSGIALWTDGSLCRMNIQSISPNAIHNYKSFYKNTVELKSASFVSCFINMKYARMAGYPITDFFIYGDDMEYTMRLTKYAPGYLNPYSIVVHKMASNEGINIIDVDKARIDRYYYNYRNLSYIYRKYDKKEYKKFKLKYYYMKFKILLKAKNNKFKRIRTISKGFRAGKKFNPVIEKDF